MLESLAKSTIKQYEGVYKNWGKFCQSHGIDGFRAKESDIIKFLSHMLYKIKKYHLGHLTHTGLH